MAFPEHIAAVLEQYAVRSDTKAALHDLYVSLGGVVLECFADLAEKITVPAMLTPEDTLGIVPMAIERYLRRNHPLWANDQPTPGFWFPRDLGGRASGMAVPAGVLGGDQRSELTSLLETTVRRIVGESQPIGEGLLIVGRNAHFGGRPETISFDVVARDLDDAIAVGLAAGRQHTIPGSVGETSGSIDMRFGVALLWEVQPNVLKPAGARNRAISGFYRRHRNWHITTLTAGLLWLRQREITTFILRGEALVPTHQVNPEQPIGAEIVRHHNRTVSRVARSLSIDLAAPNETEVETLLATEVMNTALRAHVESGPAHEFLWRVRWHAP
ncbi:MAG TPA: hypothetical protein VMT00_02045 [Thermoanaerobaculia bacterium]|nr:hypothetical protein [Thermoanaerobaculia bacterium]